MAGLFHGVWPEGFLAAGRRLALDLVTLWLARNLWQRLRLRLPRLPFLPSREPHRSSALESKAVEELENQFYFGSDSGSRSSSRLQLPDACLSPRACTDLQRHDSEGLRETHEDRSLCVGSFGAHCEPRWGDAKLLLVMVGLPARGKSYITRHLKRYLTFEGFGARVFNAGDYRRKLVGAGQDAGFYDPENEAGRKLRKQLSNAALDDLLQWLENVEGAHVGILDATNSSAERRAELLRRCAGVSSIRIAFLESICTNQEVLEKNYTMKTKNADYVGWDEEAARRDFLQRTAQYEKRYETIEDWEADGKISYMKILNCGEKMVQHRCDGYLMSKVAGYMLNLHIEPRVIYFTRHGMSEDNAAEKLGGDSKLTREGMTFARRLRDFMRRELGWGKGTPTDYDVSEPRGGWLLVTSQMKRVRQTARPLLEDSSFVEKSGVRRVHTALLNEIAAGVCDGYTAKEFEQAYPQEHRARVKDKLRYRYPRGESYLDLVQRVKPVVMEIEREKRPALVIAHQAVLRTIIAFFQGTPLEEMTELEIPLHTVLKLTITPHGCDVQRVALTEGANLPTPSSSEDFSPQDSDFSPRTLQAARLHRGANQNRDGSPVKAG